MIIKMEIQITVEAYYYVLIKKKFIKFLTHPCSLYLSLKFGNSATIFFAKAHFASSGG